MQSGLDLGYRNCPRSLTHAQMNLTHLTRASPCEACSAFTRVAARTLAPSPISDRLPGGFRHFIASMPAPVASGWSGRRVGLAPTGKRRLFTAHAIRGNSPLGRPGFRVLRKADLREFRAARIPASRLDQRRRRDLRIDLMRRPRPGNGAALLFGVAGRNQFPVRKLSARLGRRRAQCLAPHLQRQGRGQFDRLGLWLHI